MWKARSRPKNGGGGGNRTRVRRQIHAGLYVRSPQFWSRPPCSPRTGSTEDPPLNFAGDAEALIAGYPPVNDALLWPLKAQAAEDELLLVKQPVRLVGRHFLVCHSFNELLAISARNLHSTIPVETMSPPRFEECALFSIIAISPPLGNRFRGWPPTAAVVSC
jgi:hypothetical protein